MINENKSVRDLKRMVLIGAIVALVSQLYWNLFVYNFRISSSVIVLPVLLMTLGKNLSTTMTCSVTAVIVFLFRLIAAVNGGADLIHPRKIYFQTRSSISATGSSLTP